MAKEDLIDQIITNGCGCFKETDREFLEDLTENRLEELVSNSAHNEELELAANAASEGFIDPAGNKHIFVDGEWLSEMVEELAANSRPKTIDEWYADAPEEIQEAVRESIQVRNERKSELVTKLVANVADEKERERLTVNFSKKSLDELRDLVAVLPTAVSKPAVSISSMLGAPVAVPTGNSAQSADKFDRKDTLAPPTINWAS